MYLYKRLFKGNEWEKYNFEAFPSGVNSLSWAPSSDMGSLICEPSAAEKNERKKRLVAAGNGNDVHIYEEGIKEITFSDMILK